MACQREKLLGSICLNIYTDPVTLQCGRNNVCVDHALDAQEGYKGYSCPECRNIFLERPAGQKNIKLRIIMKKSLSTQPGEEASRVFCRQCIYFPEPVLISCVNCQVSVCEDHLRIYNTTPEHVLCESTIPLEGSSSFIHQVVLKYSCTGDAAGVSTSFSLVGTHRGNQVESLAEASKRKNQQLREIMREIEEIEVKIHSLEECKNRAQEKTDRKIEKLISRLSYCRRKMKDEEKQLLTSIFREADKVPQYHDSAIWQLKAQKYKLTKKMRHTEEMCSATDPLTISREQIKRSTLKEETQV